MTEKRPCPHCEAMRDVEPIQRDETVTIQGRDVRFTAKLFRCTICGEEFESAEQLDANLSAAREAYSRTYESPNADELVALRSRYGASQKAFGLILGFGELTMNTYESGALPNSSNRLLLKLAENPIVFNAMYAINASRIGAIQRQRIESSRAFQAAASWDGLDALGTALTDVQRKKIEECAESNQRTVLQQVVAFVSSASFIEYSRLVHQVTWSQAPTRPISDQPKRDAIDLSQAAS